MAGSTHTAAAQRTLQDLPTTLCQLDGWADCLQALKQGKQATFDAVWGSGCALLVSALADQGFPAALVVTASDRDMDELADDLGTFGVDGVERFPACPTVGTDELAADEQFGQRLRLLRQIGEGGPPPVVVASVSGLLEAVPAPDAFFSSTRRFVVDESVDIAELKSWLQANGYQATSAVDLPGEFSSRGGILDIFPPDALQPVRLEFFDDVVESIRIFDVRSQRSIERCQEVEIHCLPRPDLGRATLLSYLPSGTLVLVAEPSEVGEHANQFASRSNERARVLDYGELQRQWANFPLATANRLAAGRIEPQCKLPMESLGQFNGDLSEIRSVLDRLGEDHQVHLVANSEAEIDRVTEILQSTRVATSGRLQISQGHIHEGFRLRHIHTVVLSCDQLFQRNDLRRASRRRVSRSVDSFTDLKKGDLIVHMSHGIGRFRGLKLLEHNGHQSEHLELEFADRTKVYVSVQKIGLVQKYIGGTKTQPKLAKIGGKSWVKQKQAAETAVHDLAAEMLELQARRTSKPGIRFQPDTQWQYEFEHSFPYHETADQVTAIEAIKSDMESERPMDRLLCGDVGFGKTEIAMRAAFKAVESGYQVAILVPTTVLAEQHFQTFRQRMSEFPITIARLSRFATVREQRETLGALQRGSIDIIIGTHRLASADVAFKNLGLLIIDEEQRFGVGVKERLKALRAEVDVLTMTATPIPRTLHLSMVGVRDISNLTTAPEDRISIETSVTRFDASLIREAILRELNRDGQVFFLHNRVGDIQAIKQQLLQLVPEARIVVGHGQMAETELERAMTQFVAREYDVLLATTIIENGLDIPNANTIIINNAERFGLAELHQLRGRVGRYKHRAYCYLVLNPNTSLTPVAAKRLQAIEHYSDMGAGFDIAMRDLEIRGAGNLLGTEQSGHIAAIGYEMYCQLLEAAVRKLKQLPAKISIDVDIELPLNAYIPDSYIADRQQKLEIYKRLHELSAFDDLDKLEAELRDRFGPPPAPVKRLLKLGRITLEAAVWQIRSIFIEEDRYLGFRFGDTSRVQQLIAQSTLPLRAVGDSTVFVTLKPDLLTPDRLIKLVQSILQTPERVA